MNNLIVRSATEHDAIAVVQIYIDSWNEGFRGLMPQRQMNIDIAERWKQDLMAPLPYRWWVAETDRVVGFVGIGPSRDPIDQHIGELDTIAVDPEMWRHGVGEALHARALQFLNADGYREAIVWTLTGYERGQRFYEAMGWTLDGATRSEGRQVRYRRRLVP